MRDVRQLWRTILSALAEFLTPTYTGMSLAVLCGNVDKTFLARTSGPRGTIMHYAEHTKDETIAGLTYDESVRVLKDAAGRARETARRKLHELAVPFRLHGHVGCYSPLVRRSR